MRVFWSLKVKLCPVSQDPGEHGRQHRGALLQRGHVRPRHRQLRRRAEDHADGDLRGPGRTAGKKT